MQIINKSIGLENVVLNTLENVVSDNRQKNIHGVQKVRNITCTFVIAINGFMQTSFPITMVKRT